MSQEATRFVRDLGVRDTLVGIDRASAEIPGLDDVPVVDLEQALAMRPDILLVPSQVEATVFALPRSVPGTRVVEFAPHDLEDVFNLCRTLGRDLAGEAAASRLEHDIARPLALIAGRSPSTDRTRVAALVNAARPMLAGGHSFATDLIEIAGGTSVTHGDEENRHPFNRAVARERKVDLIVALMAGLTEREEQDVRDLTPSDVEILFYELDPRTFWWNSPKVHAERLQAALAGLPSPRPTPTPAP